MKGYITEFLEWTAPYVELEVPEGHVLAAATKGESGEIFYFTIQEDEGEDKRSTVDAFLYKADYAGNVIKKKQVDTTKQTGINIYGMHTSCLLAYNNIIDEPRLSIHMARTMTQVFDGLNHQGGHFGLYYPDTLEEDKIGSWETASHSMGDSLMISSSGNYIGMEIGDNYPRGILFFYTDGKGSRKKNTIYQVKTHHGETAENP